MGTKPNKNLEQARTAALTSYKNFNLETMDIETFGTWISEVTKNVFAFNVCKAMLNPDVK